MNNGVIKQKSNLIKDCDDLKLGNCVCCIKDKYTGKMRYAQGSVVPIPYAEHATSEDKAKYGKNMVYVIYRDNEDIVGYYQNSKSRIVRPGETWSINDSKTRGHKSTITDVKNGVVHHIPRTHSPVTRNEHNIPLQVNPDPNDSRQSYVVSKVQRTDYKNIGKKQQNQDIKNPIDKSLIRHLKNVDRHK